LVDTAELLVVGTGCAICHAVMCDQVAVISKDHPFVVDARLLKLVRSGEWDMVKELLIDAMLDWNRASEEYRKVHPELPADTDILPFLVTMEGRFIAKEVYTQLDKMREAGR
jgi:hypothetical protein